MPIGHIRNDVEFKFDEFTLSLKNYDISFCRSTCSLSQKSFRTQTWCLSANIFAVIIYISWWTQNLLDVSAGRISNEMYWTDMLSTFAIAKCYSNPIDKNFLPHATHRQLITTHDELKAKRKLTPLLRPDISKS